MTPEASAAFGERRARDAADEAVQFTLDHGTDPSLIDPQRRVYTESNLTEGVVGHMTPDLADLWRARVESALEGDEEAANMLDGLQLYSLDEPTWRRPAAGPLIASQQVTDVEVGVLEATAALEEPDTALVTLQHRTFARVDTDKNPVEVTITREMANWMVPGAGEEWLISSYDGPYLVQSRAVLG